jgi:hypothetical protein
MYKELETKIDQLENEIKELKDWNTNVEIYAFLSIVIFAIFVLGLGIGYVLFST